MELFHILQIKSILAVNIVLILIARYVFLNDLSKIIKPINKSTEAGNHHRLAN